VLNFEGQLLPVEDSGGVLAAVQDNPKAQIIVVVCREGNRHVGIAVSHVLDVAAGGDLFEAGTRRAPAASRCSRTESPAWLIWAAWLRCPPGNRQTLNGTRLWGRWHEYRCSSTDINRFDQPQRESGNCISGGDVYGTPGKHPLRRAITHILEIVGAARPQPVPLAPVFVGGLVHYRGDVLTTVSLRQLLNLPPKEGRQDLLVLESAGGIFGLLVDSVGEVLTVSSADHEPNPSILDERRRVLFAGAYKLKDTLLVMLDPEQLEPMRLSAARAA